MEKKDLLFWPGQIAQLFGASSRYAKVVCSIPAQGMYKINQWMHK